MTSTAVVYLALFAIVAQCHVLIYRGQGPKKSNHSREKRSCYVCEYGNEPPPPPPPGFGPPPPPPYFRTHNWSGLSRSADGTQQGVFSGANAAANSQSTGQTFSLASSSAGASAGNQPSGQSRGYSAYAHRSTETGYQPFGYGTQSAANAEVVPAGGQNQVGFNGQNNFGLRTLNKYTSENRQFNGQGLHGLENQQQAQSSTGGRGYGSSQANSASSARSYGSGLSGVDEQQQVQSTDGSFQNWHGHAYRPEKFQNADSLGVDNEQQVQSSGNGQWEQGGGDESNDFRSSQNEAASHDAGFSVSRRGDIGADSGQKALKSSLDLASQGLHTAQQNVGCNTCGKTSYALSNAKSNTGSAIALSIGR